MKEVCLKLPTKFFALSCYVQKYVSFIVMYCELTEDCGVTIEDCGVVIGDHKVTTEDR